MVEIRAGDDDTMAPLLKLLDELLYGGEEQASVGPGGAELVAGWRRGLSAGVRQYLRGYHRAGSQAEGRALFVDVAERFPRVAAMAGLSYAALFLPFLVGASMGCQGFVVDCSAVGERLGKSTAQKVVASLAGHPLFLIRSFNATPITIGNLLAASHGMPLMLEDTPLLVVSGRESSGKCVGRLIESVARGRVATGAEAGRSRATRAFNAVMVIASREPLSGIRGVAQQEGALDHVVSLGPPFGEFAREVGDYIAYTVAPTICANYGHIVPVLVSGLLQRAQALGGLAALEEELRAKHRQHIERTVLLLGRTGDLAGDCRATRLAEILGAGTLALAHLLDASGVDAARAALIIAAARSAVLADNEDALAALSLVR